MKKIYLFLFALTLGVFSIKAQNQQTATTCSIDPTYNRYGIYPDSATNFVSGTVGTAYYQNITVRVPDDTLAAIPIIGTQKVCFTRFELTAPSGITNYNLPPGLSILAASNLTTSTGFKFPAAQDNCVSIEGTPTTAGTYTLQMKISPYGSINAQSYTCPTPPADGSGGTLLSTAVQTIKYYIIQITDPAGVQEINGGKMLLYQNSPNPFSSNTEIKFYVTSEEQVNISVYNALGKLVYEKSTQSQIGENKLNINTENWSNGLYFYSLKYKGAISTKRMIVTGN